MLMSSMLPSSSSLVTSTLDTSTRGSHQPIASKTYCATCPWVSALFGANTRSWMPHPNCGRIWRSPLAVPRMMRIASSMSVFCRERAMPPLGLMRSGKAQPLPRKSPSGICNSSLVQVDGQTLDIHRSRSAGDVHAHRAADRDLAAARAHIHAHRAADRGLAGAGSGVHPGLAGGGDFGRVGLDVYVAGGALDQDGAGVALDLHTLLSRDLHLAGGRSDFNIRLG